MKTNNKGLPLDQFIEFALYDKVDGYYMKKNPFGKVLDHQKNLIYWSLELEMAR